MTDTHDRSRPHSQRRVPRASVSAAVQTITPRSDRPLPSSLGTGTRPWELYHQVGELRSGIEWIANNVSRADFYVARRTPKGLERVDDPEISALLDPLLGSTATQGTILKRAFTHLEAAGETYLVPVASDSGIEYRTASSRELQIRADGVQVAVGPSDFEPAAGKIIRIWYPHPELSYRAESPILAMEPVLLQIIALTARMTAVADSRAAGNGIFGLPDSMTALGPASQGTANPVRLPDVVTALEDAMLTPMQDRGSASSVVPLILTGTPEEIAAIRRIDLFSPLDERAPDQLDQALRRMAMSMGVPPEIVLSLGDTNHWSAATIVEEAINSAVEPRVDTVASAFTTSYLRPQLRRMRLDPEEYVVAFDLTDLKNRPDRSDQAERAREHSLLTDEAWARHVGFDRSDIPEGKERERIVLENLLRADPSTAPWVLPAIGIHVPGMPDPGASTADGGPGPVAAPETELPKESSDDRQPPRPVTAALTDADPDELLVAAVESGVLRILEYGGNRLYRTIPRGDRANLRDVPRIELHAHLPITEDTKGQMLGGPLDTWQKQMPELAPLISSYVTYLLDHRLPHTRELLKDTLTALGDEWMASAAQSGDDHG